MYMFLESFQSFGLHLVRSGDKKVPTTSPKYTPNSCVDTLPPCESLKTFSNNILLQGFNNSSFHTVFILCTSIKVPGVYSVGCKIRGTS